MRYYQTLVRLFSRLNLAFAILGAAILFFVTAIIFLEVVGRAVTGSSQLWVIEVSEYAMLYITFLGAPYLLEKNRHVMLDLLYGSLTGTWRRIAGVTNAALGFFLCAVLTYVGVVVVLDQIDSGAREITVMAPPSYWLTIAFPLGMALMTFQFFDQGLRALTSRYL
ncbi:MAG: TRAP transporter small permease [Paracoccaceae bacterium]